MQFASHKRQHGDVMPEATSPRSHTETGREQNTPSSCRFFLSPSSCSSHLSNLFTTLHPLCCPPDPRHPDQAPAWSSSLQPWNQTTCTKTLQPIRCNWRSSNKTQIRSPHSLLKTGQWLPTALHLPLLKVSGPLSLVPACTSTFTSAHKAFYKSATRTCFLEHTLCPVTSTSANAGSPSPPSPHGMLQVLEPRLGGQ